VSATTPTRAIAILRPALTPFADAAPVCCGAPVEVVVVAGFEGATVELGLLDVTRVGTEDVVAGTEEVNLLVVVVE